MLSPPGLQWDGTPAPPFWIGSPMRSNVSAGWLATLQTMEQGAPLAFSDMFVASVPVRIRAIARSRAAERVLIDDAKRRVTERWHPLGVVAAIAPWNGPLILGIIKVATALIAGNTIVLKPSELTPLSTLELGRISRGLLPDGVLNIVGGGGTIGAAMVAHPGFDKVSFTGSTRTGLAIAQRSAEMLRPVMLELGGNDARNPASRRLDGCHHRDGRAARLRQLRSVLRGDQAGLCASGQGANWWRKDWPRRRTRIVSAAA